MQYAEASVVTKVGTLYVKKMNIFELIFKQFFNISKVYLYFVEILYRYVFHLSLTNKKKMLFSLGAQSIDIMQIVSRKVRSQQ